MKMGDGKDQWDHLEDPITVRNVFADSFSSLEVNAPRPGSSVTLLGWIVMCSSGISSGASAYLYYPVLIQRAIKKCASWARAPAVPVYGVLERAACPLFKIPKAWTCSFCRICKHHTSLLRSRSASMVGSWHEPLWLLFHFFYVLLLMSWPYGIVG